LANDHDYYFEVLNNLIKKKMIKVQALDIGNKFCKDVDTKNDLNEIRDYFAMESV